MKNLLLPWLLIKTKTSGRTLSAYVPTKTLLETSSHITGLSNDQDIVNLFADLFAETLNVCAEADCALSTLPVCSSAVMLQHRITPELVPEAFKHLKRNKSDGSELDSCHLIFASEAISESLSSLFTAVLRHGHFPASISDCTLVPVPKRGKDIAQSELQGYCSGFKYQQTI
jgi:hypothetical protein